MQETILNCNKLPMGSEQGCRKGICMDWSCSNLVPNSIKNVGNLRPHHGRYDSGTAFYLETICLAFLFVFVGHLALSLSWFKVFFSFSRYCAQVALSIYKSPYPFGSATPQKNAKINLPITLSQIIYFLTLNHLCCPGDRCVYNFDSSRRQVVAVNAYSVASLSKSI